MPRRIVLPAVTPAGGIRTYGSRFLSTTGTRQIASRRKLDEETGEEVAIDLNKEARQNFAAWVNGPGNNFRRPLYNQTNYLSSYDRKGLLAWQRLQGARLQGSLNMPFPLNPHFRSHPVLSEDLKEHIHNLVMVRGRTVRSVSAELGVSLERVSAVVRLKEVEKKWVAEVGCRRCAVRRGAMLCGAVLCCAVLCCAVAWSTGADATGRGNLWQPS